MAVVSYGVLVAVMLATGLLVARETGRTSSGLLASAAVGVSAQVMPVAIWYSASQILWAGLGILTTLLFLRSWCVRGGPLRLATAAVAAVVAGWLWTIGFLAGPIGAVFLWVEGDRRSRRAAVIPLAASAIALVVAMAAGGPLIDARQNFHGLPVREAIGPLQGMLHTAQAIPEYLIVGSLGLSAETTPIQGVILTVGLILMWIICRRDRWTFNRLECAGAALVFASYWIQCTARGYAPFWMIRLIAPWYHAVPQIGAVLLLFGWVSNCRKNTIPDRAAPAPVTWEGVICVILVTIALVALNHPRVEAIWENSVLHATWLTTTERGSSRKGMPTRIVALDRAIWQRRHLVKLEDAEATARRLGIGRDAIHRVFGRLDVPNIPSISDALDLLDLPGTGPETDPDRIRRALGHYVRMSPEPPLPWSHPEGPQSSTGSALSPADPSL